MESGTMKRSLTHLETVAGKVLEAVLVLDSSIEVTPFDIDQ